MKNVVSLISGLACVLVLACCVPNADGKIPGPEYNNDSQKYHEQFKNETLLTDRKENVQTMKIKSSLKEANNFVYVVYEEGKDNQKINDIYDNINNTDSTYHEVSLSEEGQQSNPVFTIDIYYKNGTINEIASTETGALIYRNTGTNLDWIGGKNEDLQNLLRSFYSENLEEHKKNIEEAETLVNIFIDGMKKNDLDVIKAMITEKVDIKFIEGVKSDYLQEKVEGIIYADGKIELAYGYNYSNETPIIRFILIKDSEDKWVIDSFSKGN